MAFAVECFDSQRTAAAESHFALLQVTPNIVNKHKGVNSTVLAVILGCNFCLE
jgi:hypothetical protein